MTDPPSRNQFDRQADRLMAEMGLSADSPPGSLTYEAGVELGTRLLSSTLVTPRIVKSCARDILYTYRGMFPTAPDSDELESQSYFWAPWVAKWLTGRGLTVPQIARLAGVDTDHVYRLMRAGLRICFIEHEPPPRSGVNKRYSGVDGRETYLIPDPTGLTERPWPAAAEEYRPFIRGLMAGLQAWLSDPDNKARLEPRFIEAFASVLRDPALRDVFDGALCAIQRISLDLRDKVLRMKVEKDRASDLARAMAQLASKKELVFEILAQAAGNLTAQSSPSIGAGRA